MHLYLHLPPRCHKEWNMLDAPLPPPLPVNDVMDCFKEVMDGKAKPVEEDIFNGILHKDSVGKLAGTMGLHKNAIRLVLNFEAWQALKGVELMDLDVFFEQFAKFVIDACNPRRKAAKVNS